MKKASSVVPDSLEVQYNIAVIDEAQGKYDEAIVVLNRLADKDRARRWRLLDLRQEQSRRISGASGHDLSRGQDKTQLADETFRKMLVLGDDNAVRGYQQIIETYRDNKQWQQATNVAEEAAKKFPDDRDLQMVAASQQADMGSAAARH